MKKEDVKQNRHAEGYISATPLPTSEELKKFYAELYYQTPQSSTYQENYEDIELSFKRIRCDALLHAIKEHGVTSGEFLDIGAGEGFLMNAAQQQGFSITGMDFSSFGVEKFFPALKKHLIAGDIYENIAELSKEDKKIMACTAINVLEHVIDPDLFLSSIRKVIDPNGLLAITVPNDFSGLQMLLQKEGLIDHEFWFLPPQHLHYFNTKNMETFCTARGYKVLDAFSDFPIDIFLLHAGSNYVMDPKNGPSAHRARMLHDIMIAEAGIDKYLDYYRAMFNVGIGRCITMILQPDIN
jgi:2-polyprenyl-3-methyl-5-hydroxy-6-metoxy-1,4-benzoquinol methylase